MAKDLRAFFENFKIPLALGLLGVLLILGGFIFSSVNKSSKQNTFPKESIVDAKLISIDVAGSVQNPGVYKLEEGKRVEDAIIAAGGFEENANKEYISKYLNMAQKLSDGSKIYIPKMGETASGNGGASLVTGTSVHAQVNINSSTQAELEALPGIGPVTASKIISDRPYQKIEDLLDKKIVNKSTFEKIKDSIIVY